MKTFNVIIYDPNHKKFVPYNVIPYFVQAYEELKEKKYKKLPKTFEEFKEFVKDESLYQFWSRCEYEIILKDWPCGQKEEKWDVYGQIMMNIDLITRLLMEDIFDYD